MGVGKRSVAWLMKRQASPHLAASSRALGRASHISLSPQHARDFISMSFLAWRGRGPFESIFPPGQRGTQAAGRVLQRLRQRAGTALSPEMISFPNPSLYM